MTPKSTQISPTARSFQRAVHRLKILELIRTTELISRTDFARATGLSQASITGMTANLIQEGLIEEKQPGAYEGGRRPTLLAIRPDGVHVVGINIAIHELRVVIVNFQAELQASHTTPLVNDSYSPEEMVSIIVQAIQACIWEANFSKDLISGVGVGISGPVDSGTGVIRFLPNYGWENVPFREMLQAKINCPVFIDNSSNNLAIGVSGQQHGMVPLDKTGEVIRPAKLWCDTETVQQCATITSRIGGEQAVVDTIGNQVAAGFTASKILWMLEKGPENYDRLASILLPHD